MVGDIHHHPLRSDLFHREVDNRIGRLDHLAVLKNIALVYNNFVSMKEKTSAGAARIEQAECNQARLRLLRRSLFYPKNLSKKLHRIDILRKFAFGMTVIRDGHRTLRTMISVTLPFDSRKSRKLKRISQGIASDVHALYMAWAAPAVLLIRVVREPTWAKCRRVCPRLLFLLIAIMPMAAVSQNSRQTESTRTYKLKNSKTHSTMPQIIKTKEVFVLAWRNGRPI